MNALAEAPESRRERKRPMYGSVWLALFVLLRDGAGPAAAERPVSRDGSPSPRP